MFKKIDKTSKFYEFWSLFLFIIGICVGSGIYLKNQEIIEQTKNPLIAIILWLAIGFICVASIITFIEIARSTSEKGNGTISNWAKLFINRKVASLYSVFYMFIYMPAYQSIFVGCSILYFLEMIGAKLDAYQLFLVFAIVGIFLLASAVAINLLTPNFSKSIQIYSLLLRYIPLILVFFAGFILAITGIGSENGLSSEAGADLTVWNLFGGFGAILFSFDGYIFTANTQKNAKHKEVVGKAILFGLIFITIFYFLMAVSLFLGGNGSVEDVLMKVLSGGKGKNDQNTSANKIAKIITLLIMTSIFTLNINMFTHFGITSMMSDHNMKLVYLPEHKNQLLKAGQRQFIITSTFFLLLIMCALFFKSKGFDGITDTLDKFVERYTLNNPSIAGKLSETRASLLAAFNATAILYIGQMASVAVVLQFGLIASLIMAAMVNRFTNKITVEKQKGFWPCSIISFVLIIVINIFGVFVFIVPDLFRSLDKKSNWAQSGGMMFTIILVTSLLFVVIIWLLQEKLFVKKPFENGFEGIVDENMAINNWAQILVKHKEIK